MDYSRCNVSHLYPFSPVNIHVDQPVNPPGGCFTFPSPEYGARQLNTYDTYIPQQILYPQPPTGSQNVFKSEYLDNDLVLIIPNDDVDSKITSLGTDASPLTNTVTNTCTLERNFVNYPLTPKTPLNDKFFPELPTPTSPPIEMNFDLANYYYTHGYYYLHFANPRDPVTAFANFVEAAKLGSTKGKHQVAYCYQHGIGVAKDPKEAVRIYDEIIKSNPQSAPSLCQLGFCYQNGIGVPVNEMIAFNFYERAALFGNIDAMFNLAYCLRRGVGTPVDYQGAYGIYLRLAELGDPQGMKLVGNCKFAGIGTPKNETEALGWFHRSSKYDFYWGGKMQYALSIMDDTQNHKEALRLIKEVCENFPLCPGPNKLMLGKCYHSGIGCTPDLQKALYWYEQALQSYFMTPAIVQECEQLIDDIRHNGYSNGPVVVKSERIVVDRSDGKAAKNFST